MGMEIAAITIFGMLGLLIAEVRADEAPPAETMPVHQGRQDEEHYKKAA